MLVMDQQQQQNSMEKAESAIISTLELLNFQPPSRTATLLAKLLQSIAVYMISQSIAIMFFGWKEWSFGSRVAAMENLTYSFGFFSISTDLFLMSNRTFDLISMIRSKYYLFEVYNFSILVREKKIEMINMMEKATVDGVILIEKILRCLFIGYMTLPAVSIIFYYLKLSKIEDLRLPFIIFVPELYPISLTFSTIYHYLFSTCLNIVYLFYSAVITITVFKIMLLSVNNVLTEMKLFRLNFEEIDIFLEEKGNKGFETTDIEKVDIDLKRMMRHVAVHHQVIFKKVGILNSGLKFRLFYFNTFSCLQICLSIFSFMRGEFTFKMKHGVVIFGVVMNCFFICDLGQKLQDQWKRSSRNNSKDKFTVNSSLKDSHWLRLNQYTYYTNIY